MSTLSIDHNAFAREYADKVLVIARDSYDGKFVNAVWCPADLRSRD